MIREQRQELSPLRWQWLLVGIFYAVVLLLSYDLLRRSVQPQQSLQWLLLSTIAMAIQLGILWWALPYNLRQGPSLRTGESPLLLPSLGYANTITLLRGLLACMLAGFLFAPQPAGWLAWVPALLYTLERLVDFADGYVARITRRETKLGEILDIEFDGLGILIAIALGVQYGKLPPWYLLLGLARQLFVLGMWLLASRRQAGIRPAAQRTPAHDCRLPNRLHHRHALATVVTIGHAVGRLCHGCSPDLQFWPRLACRQRGDRRSFTWLPTGTRQRQAADRRLAAAGRPHGRRAAGFAHPLAGSACLCPLAGGHGRGQRRGCDAALWRADLAWVGGSGDGVAGRSRPRPARSCLQPSLRWTLSPSACTGTAMHCC